MIKLNQIWAWIWDEPRQAPTADNPWPAEDPNATGRWEVRGTGVVDEYVPVGKTWRFL